MTHVAPITRRQGPRKSRARSAISGGGGSGKCERASGHNQQTRARTHARARAPIPLDETTRSGGAAREADAGERMTIESVRARFLVACRLWRRVAVRGETLQVESGGDRR